jgi:nucleoid-associated protein YgaU
MITNRGKLLADVLGVGVGGGDLQKLTIQHEEKSVGKFTGSIRALFNPTELSYGREVKWEQKRLADKGYASSYAVQEFTSTEPSTLTVNLFFDTYEAHDGKVTLGHLKAAVLPTVAQRGRTSATSVQEYTKKLEGLAAVKQELHRPPQCRLKWGRYEFFAGVLTNLSYSYTMFLPDGTPVRASAACTFTERMLEAYKRELHSPDVARRYVVRRNDTLQSIAAEFYGDPAQWRVIARANGILNPRRLQPGVTLVIPPLQP